VSAAFAPGWKFSYSMPDLIKVLIVEDSPTVARILISIIESDPVFQIVGVATDGAEAVRMTSRLRPNIITMDVNMPRMSGIEATEYIMAHQPTPILVLTAFSRQDVDLSFKMLSAGALEIMQKPDAAEWQLRKFHIIERLKLLSRIKVITHVRGKSRQYKEIPPPPPRDSIPTAPLDPKKVYRPASPEIAKTPPPLTPVPGKVTPAPVVGVPSQPEPQLLTRRFDVVGIAASTGGPPALAKLLAQFPANWPVPVFVVQHIPAGFSAGLADWLNAETPLKVKLAQEDEMPQPGFAYLPADDRHMTFQSSGRVHLDDSPARYGLRPSADFTFESMSRVWSGKTIAVILTGMGRDGSQGMRLLNAAGGYNIAQDEASSVIFGMPKAAIELGVVDKVLALPDIALYLKQIFKLEPLK
jgi:two-component system, chemotaxis family, protein-glutamate methylesterase/glutaminase